MPLNLIFSCAETQARHLTMNLNLIAPMHPENMQHFSLLSDA